MNILCIGDIVGSAGRQTLEGLLPGLKKEFDLDFVIANAENSAGGAGITSRIANQLFGLGCDVLTTGDHVWDKSEVLPYLAETENILRPANFPKETPGRGWCVRKTSRGVKIGVINLLGRTFMRYNVDCPFRALQALSEEIRKETPVMIVDMHAEATSEKIALVWYLDGEVSAILGTHTHVQTADERIYPKGTAFISDLGMTGPHDSVIGAEKEPIIHRFLTQMNTKKMVAKNDVRLSGAIVTVDDRSGRALSIERVHKKVKA